MSMSRIKYFFNQAKKNIFRNGLMSVASLFTILCCLVILGIFMIISLNVEYVTEQIKDQCEIQVFMDIDTPDERISAIGDEILAMENVREIELYTKEQMLEEVKLTIFADNPELVESFDNEDNPFSDSYKIVLEDIMLASETATSLEDIENIETVTNKQDVVNMVVSISETVQNATLVIMLLLLLVAVVIISNTVRLTVFNRRKEIGIMKYIGATDFFVRAPFVLEGMLIGLAGAAVPLLMIHSLYNKVLTYVTERFTMLTSILNFLSVEEIFKLLLPVSLIVGVGIGFLGSIVTVRKHLHV